MRCNMQQNQTFLEDKLNNKNLKPAIYQKNEPPISSENIECLIVGSTEKLKNSPFQK
jgi:hypothetical protein